MHGTDDCTRYRIHGTVGADPTAYLLRDLTRGEPAWATLADCSGGDTHPWSGTVLTGERRAGDPLGTLADWNVTARDSLAVVESDATLSEVVWEAWDRRTAGQRRVTTVLPDERCEVHVGVPPPDSSPERVFERMLTGAYSFEPWFEDLVELDARAAHLTVVSPPDRSAFVVFATPPDAPTAPVRQRRDRLGLRPFPEP
jgi:hypothetical protein